MFLFVYFQFCFIFSIKVLKKNVSFVVPWMAIESVCFVHIVTCVPWMAIETKFSKLCFSCNLDKHLNAQLSK